MYERKQLFVTCMIMKVDCIYEHFKNWFTAAISKQSNGQRCEVNGYISSLVTNSKVQKNRGQKSQSRSSVVELFLTLTTGLLLPCRRVVFVHGRSKAVPSPKCGEISLTNQIFINSEEYISINNLQFFVRVEFHPLDYDPHMCNCSSFFISVRDREKCVTTVLLLSDLGDIDNEL